MLLVNKPLAYRFQQGGIAKFQTPFGSIQHQYFPVKTSYVDLSKLVNEDKPVEESTSDEKPIRTRTLPNGITLTQDNEKRVDFSKIDPEKDNRKRGFSITDLNQFQDSLIARGYPEAQRLSLLATALDEAGPKGAASQGKGGNGYLGFSWNILPDREIITKATTPEGRGRQIKYILDKLETQGDPWLGGDSIPPYIKNSEDAYRRFWTASEPDSATLYLNKGFIRPKDPNDRQHRAEVSRTLQQKARLNTFIGPYEYIPMGEDKSLHQDPGTWERFQQLENENNNRR